MTQKKRIVIVGASSAIAHQCARVWVQSADTDILLIGRDHEKLSRIAADLTARSNPTTTSINTLIADLLSPQGIQSAVSQACAAGPVDIVLIAHGTLTDQQTAQTDLTYSHEQLNVNAISPALFAEGFVASMIEHNRGTLAVIGSVAGDRGRKSNYIYGAAKGLLARYMQGLQHRLAGTQVKAIIIKPGPTDTPMTAVLKAQGAKLASVESVAETICAAIAKGSPSVYAPGKWRLIMLIIQHLPGIIFNKLNI